MTDLDREDRQKIADAAEKLVAVSALRRIHILITLEAIGNAKAKRLAGALGGTVIGLFFLALFLMAFRDGIENRHLSPQSFFDILPTFLPSALMALVPLSFAVHFLTGYRYSMGKCLAAGFLLAVLIGSLAAWYQAHISI